MRVCLVSLRICEYVLCSFVGFENLSPLEIWSNFPGDENAFQGKGTPFLLVLNENLRTSHSFGCLGNGGLYMYELNTVFRKGSKNVHQPLFEPLCWTNGHGSKLIQELNR